MSEMDSVTYGKVKTLCKQGAKLDSIGDYDRAISKYYEALTMFPERHPRNPVAAYLYTALGESYWNLRDYENAGEAFCEAYECPNMNSNPQITLRIGQCLTECGDLANARDYLRHAVAIGGKHLLEECDKKYYYVLHPEPVAKPKVKAADIQESDIDISSPLTDAPDISPADTAVQTDIGVTPAAVPDFAADYEPIADTSADADGHTSYFSRFGDAGVVREPSHPAPDFSTDFVSMASAQAASDDAAAEPSAAAAPNAEAASEKKQGFFSRIFSRKEKKE